MNVNGSPIATSSTVRRSVFPPILEGCGHPSGGKKGKTTVGLPKNFSLRSWSRKEKDRNNLQEDYGWYLKKKKDPIVLLQSWDNLLEIEKKKTLWKLQQRVSLQRQLIAKQNIICQEQRASTARQRNEEILSRKSQRKQLVKAIRCHSMRKTRRSVSAPDGALRTRKEEREGGEVEVVVVEEEEEEEEGEDEGEKKREEGEYKDLSASNRGLEGGNIASDKRIWKKDVETEPSMTIEKMWSILKANATKKFKPVILHSHKVSQFASPSARQCLDLYEMRTAKDKFTGKLIPLGQILSTNRSSAMSRGSASTFTSVMSLLTRQTQMKAEFMLRNRSDLYNDSVIPRLYEDWYLVKSDRRNNDSASTEISSTRQDDKTSVELREHRAGNSAKILTYLTAGGEYIPGYPDPLGSNKTRNWSPSKTKSSRRERKTKESPSVIFMTEVASPKMPPQDTIDYDDEVLRSRSKIHHKFKRRQPLSTDALLKYTRVTELPVSGVGHLGHGTYQMWRPRSMYANLNSLINVVADRKSISGLHKLSEKRCF